MKTNKELTLEEAAEEYVNSKYNAHQKDYFTQLRKGGIINQNMEDKFESFIAGANHQKSITELSKKEMFENMQYYMEHCKIHGYVTPMDWLLKYKHF